MHKIGVLSDTHGELKQGVKDFFKDCNQIWHAGDIADFAIIKELREIAEVKAVYGNIDHGVVKHNLTKHEIFECEGKKVFITHIGGYPGRYDREALEIIQNIKPDIFVCGHSHILKVIFDKKNELLHINPGAAGHYGIHNISTAIRFDINEGDITNMEILELEK